MVIFHSYDYVSLIPYPLVICYIAIENGPVEIVDLMDFPMKNGDFPWLLVSLAEGSSHSSAKAQR
jgi:hypothetical protein